LRDFFGPRGMKELDEIENWLVKQRIKKKDEERGKMGE